MAPGVSSNGSASATLPPIIHNETDGTELLLVPAGGFLRGSLQGQGDPDERPQREINLDSFYVARHPVTNAQYRKFVEATGHSEPRYWGDSNYSQDEQPVVGVTWDDAKAYCEWAGLRLPTEAEWEKAASWDADRKLKRWWAWGDSEPAADHANFGGAVGRPTPVSQYPKGVSAYGCQDMSGNVWEWVEDWYLYNYFENSPEANPKGPDKGRYKVLRGGAFTRPAGYCTTTYRYWYSTDYADFETGFRCAR